MRDYVALFIQLLLWGALLLFTPSSPVDKSKLNVLIIQVDDLGFGDLGCNGNQVIRTPHIDALSKESFVFDQFYTQSVCAPSRASLITGKHFLNVGISGVHGGRDFLNISESTIGNYFQDSGYRTGMWGKWHSGKTVGYFPWDRGFDEAYYSKLYCSTTLLRACSMVKHNIRINGVVKLLLPLQMNLFENTKRSLF